MTSSKLLRSAFGTYATGVTIVTTVDAGGMDVGMTANSFSSVSLEPPLLLWSLGRTATNFTAFNNADSFIVHVLAEHQRDLSNRFAQKGIDKFAGLRISRGLGGMPMLEGCAAYFECRTYARYDAGDHVIQLGEIVSFEHTTGAPPLLYHAGDYRQVSQKDFAGQ